jgi:hypothetical protein
MTYAALTVSLIVNIVGFFYIRWLLRTIASMEVQSNDVWNLMSEFKVHLKSVYELEMFYGDETLKSLMDHANQVTESLDEFDSILSIEEENQDDES